MFSVCIYTYTTIPVCLIACVFSVFQYHGRCVFSICVYTYTTIHLCLIACVFSAFLFHGRCVFSVCIYTLTTIHVCLLRCVFSVFLFHGSCVFSVCVYTHTTIPVCLIAYILCHCVTSVYMYTCKGLPKYPIACVFSVFLCYGHCAFSVCVQIHTTIPVFLIA